MVFIAFENSYATSSCEKWFAASKLKVENPACAIECSLLSVDMGNFDCPIQCESLCKIVSKQTKDLFDYPKGMTKCDHRMVSKYPADSIKVYEAKRKADDLTAKVFNKPVRNDETDAFRHFVWASLITKELGAEKATEFFTFIF